MQRADSLEKTLMLGKFESKRRGWCRGPAPAGSRGTLRMNGVGEREREREKEKERPGWGFAAESGNAFFYLP